jgi:hypothetical protein
MLSKHQVAVFALDCGATNWRIFRANYSVEGPNIQLLGEPLPSPPTSFSDRKLPAAILLNAKDGSMDFYYFLNLE